MRTPVVRVVQRGGLRDELHPRALVVAAQIEIESKL
jgi:hypothetical protein